MKKISLIVAGITQILLGFLHVMLAIRPVPSDATQLVYSLQIFNLAVMITVFYFAYVSFFHRDELIKTRLGKSTLVFILLFYIARLGIDIIQNGIRPLQFAIGALIIALYGIALLPFSLRQYISDNARGHSS